MDIDETRMWRSMPAGRVQNVHGYIRFLAYLFSGSILRHARSSRWDAFSKEILALSQSSALTVSNRPDAAAARIQPCLDRPRQNYAPALP